MVCSAEQGKKWQDGQAATGTSYQLMVAYCFNQNYGVNTPNLYGVFCRAGKGVARQTSCHRRPVQDQ